MLWLRELRWKSVILTDILHWNKCSVSTLIVNIFVSRYFKGPLWPMISSWPSTITTLLCIQWEFPTNAITQLSLDNWFNQIQIVGLLELFRY